MSETHTAEGPETRSPHNGEAMERHLVERAQHGDEDAFSQLAHAVAHRLYAVAYRILRDFDTAEDATQAALVAIWRQLPRLRDPDRFEAWAYRVLVNACYAEGRRAGRGRAADLSLAPEPTTVDATGWIADRDQLERGFRRLPADQRAALVLQHYLDLPLEGIAEVLGVPVGTVRSRLHYARRSMRAALEADARSENAEERTA